MSHADLRCIAIDLGASGGRVHACRLVEGRLALTEAHRFEHRPVWVPDEGAGRWSWDVLLIWEHIKRGIGVAGAQLGRVDGIGIDSWGVDYALLGADGALVHQPVAYRDPRTDAVFPRVMEKLGRSRIYGRTGIQFMPFNTVYQLACDAADAGRPLERAATMLMIPQLLAYWLTGRKVAEHTLASTTQCYDPRARQWITEFLDELGIPRHILPEVVDAQSVIGTLRPAVAAELALPVSTPVIAVGSHDTASAVVAAPLENDGRSAYLSSGTWSLLGLELPNPCMTEAALEANLTNEGGVAGTTRLLRNVSGMWLMQECRHEWAKGGRKFTYEQLMHMAEQARPAAVLFDPNDPDLLAPGDMPARIIAACRRTNGAGAVEDEPGAIIRCVLESLAANYAELASVLERVSGREIARIHIVGGGGQNHLLNRLTAQATGRVVTVGPYDATSMGNALVQAMVVGAIADLHEAREVVRRSVQVGTVEPGAAGAALTG